MTDQSPVEDAVAAVIRGWRELAPDLDTGPMGVIGRINRCAALLQQAGDAPLAREGLVRAEFDTLNTLRRLGGGVTPGRLARETFASGAAVTKRVRALADRGLVERRTDTRDRRVQHLSLTAAGRDLVDRLMPAQLSYEAALLAGLPAERRADLADGLAELLAALEGRLGGLLG
ncbi:MarR family winged helix-turn-helix transcriptional regulator [Actinomadura parmotrematis]|uniref:MarR family winged helix-turn-helix transcriptional regulator n=1 Tax=Actinomadura parmotrematis TaxID=2864039 RepID=A0ABS7FR19_9ACTN|nr:MarR family winged helix-turn-helix transcriptional regulator [Actinomadura parmotrematis]MBW8482853.1 MarR family winged helix-turn-helix transcriptional regulator [Actinomadura parmotrematis]